MQAKNGYPLKVKDKTELITDRRQSMQSMRDHLQKSCKVLREKHMLPHENIPKAPNTIDLPKRVMISEDFKLIGCKLLKVGSTNIRRLLYTLEHLETQNDTNKLNKMLANDWHIDIRFLKGKRLSEMRQKLKTYTTFMFVREPIERLMSAYRDGKPHNWFEDKISPSFIEYLELIIKTPTKDLNQHLKSFSIWCQPCSIKYDFIGRLDNFNEDMGEILERVGAKNLVILPKRNQTGYRSAKSSDVVEKYRKTIPIEILKQIYQKYNVDYYLFGFPRPY